MNITDLISAEITQYELQIYKLEQVYAIAPTWTRDLVIQERKWGMERLQKILNEICSEVTEQEHRR